MSKIITRNYLGSAPQQMDKSDGIKVYQCGRYIETVSSNHKLRGNHSPIPRKSNSKNVDKETGEIITKYKSIQNVKRALGDAKRLFYTNFERCKSYFIVTLRYKVEMKDYKKINRDLNNLHFKIRKSQPSYKYIDFPELGNHHTYHCHEVGFFDAELPFYQIKKLFKSAWGSKGQVAVNSIGEHNCMKTINYFTQYASEPILPKCIDANENIDIWNYNNLDYSGYSKAEQKQIKYYIKNMRLFYYDNNAHIYRASKQLQKPMTTKMNYSDLNALTDGIQPMFSETIKVQSENMSNTFYYSQYYLPKRESETINNYR